MASVLTNLKKLAAQQKTATRISTSTPERSDAAREAPPAGLVERYDGLRTLAEDRGELVVMDESPELTPERADAALAYAKVSSPELASLAAKYVNISSYDLEHLTVQQATAVMEDVRRLAASVLSQA